MTTSGNVTPKGPGQLRAEEWRPKFLLALRKHANVRLACEAAGISRVTAYRAKLRSAEFRRQWEEAEADACDVLEGIARQRAAASSDALLMFLLRAHRPEKYREKLQVEFLNSPEWIQVRALIVNALEPYPEALKALAEGLAVVEDKAIVNTNARP